MNMLKSHIILKNIIVEKPLALNFKEAVFLTKKFKKIQKNFCCYAK